jgi:hypothetical protein
MSANEKLVATGKFEADVSELDFIQRHGNRVFCRQAPMLHLVW